MFVAFCPVESDNGFDLYRALVAAVGVALIGTAPATAADSNCAATAPGLCMPDPL